MLNSLQIRNFAIADEIELSPGPGLNVVTGESGAGKSILIRALAQLLGQRSDVNSIKHGQSRAEVQADFDIQANEPVRTLLRTLDLDEDEECHLRRVINRDGASKAYVNGRSVTAGTLRRVGEQLLDIHGQHEHQLLLQGEHQRVLLDRYAEIMPLVEALGASFRSLQQAVEKLTELRRDARAAHEQMDFLQFQAEELDRFGPRANEWEQLQIQHQKIHHQAELINALQETRQALFQEHSAATSSADGQLGIALGALETAARVDPELEALVQMISEARTLIEETDNELRQAAERAHIDPGELERIEQRYAGYLELARKHHVEATDLYQHHQALLQRLADTEHPQQGEQRLLDEIEKQAEHYRSLATQISDRRQAASLRLAAEISELMQALAMEGGRFDIELIPAPCALTAPDTGPFAEGIGREAGRESIRFAVSTNAGMPALPLGKIASGGELSRISLAMQLVLADPAQARSLVFDEVDVGVGGKTAATIGKMLARLGKDRQILSITHLPQVAAFGRQHYHVNKQQQEGVALCVEQLDAAGREQEIARMVGGEQISSETLAHARDLLDSSRD